MKETKNTFAGPHSSFRLLAIKFSISSILWSDAMSHIILSSWLLHPSNAPLRPGSCVTTLRRESIWETRWEAGLAEREGVVSVEASYGNG